MTFDPYTELDLPRDAPQASIKPAYRKRAKATHPDSGGTKQSFNKTTRAYLILSDPARRSKYDRTGDADDVQPDNSVAISIGIVVGFFAHVAQQYAHGQITDPAKFDMVKLAREQFNQQIVEMQKHKKPIEKAAATLRKIEQKLKPQPPGSTRGDFLRDALRRQAASTAEPLAKIDREIQAHKDALTLIKDFTFDMDRDPATDVLARRGTWTSIFDAI
jgi:curved DNA-binding protein CbpA